MHSPTGLKYFCIPPPPAPSLPISPALILPHFIFQLPTRLKSLMPYVFSTLLELTRVYVNKDPSLHCDVFSETLGNNFSTHVSQVSCLPASIYHTILCFWALLARTYLHVQACIVMRTLCLKLWKIGAAEEVVSEADFGDAVTRRKWWAWRLSDAFLALWLRLSVLLETALLQKRLRQSSSRSGPGY